MDALKEHPNIDDDSVLDTLDGRSIVTRGGDVLPASGFSKPERVGGQVLEVISGRLYQVECEDPPGVLSDKQRTSFMSIVENKAKNEDEAKAKARAVDEFVKGLYDTQKDALRTLIKSYRSLEKAEIEASKRRKSFYTIIEKEKERDAVRAVYFQLISKFFIQQIYDKDGDGNNGGLNLEFIRILNYFRNSLGVLEEALSPNPKQLELFSD